MADKHFVTKQGLQKLKMELDNLKNVERKKIADRIEYARSLGDLSENAEYHDAQEQRAFVEGRIAELEDLIKRSEVIDQSKKNRDVVTLGAKVRVKNLEDATEHQFEITGSNEANPSEGRISNESPLGQAFLGQKKGDQLEVTVPNGIVKYTILDVQ